jgi:CheY-like chemotaxis protein
VLVVDDEAVYREAIKAFFARLPELAEAIHCIEASSSAQALHMAREHALDLVVTDIDLGPNSQDGFAVVHELRRVRRLGALICVHSTRMCPGDHKTAIEHGADSFLPKPMARSHLLQLVLQAAEQTGTVRPEVAIIDDNAFVLDAWTATLAADTITHAFASPEELMARLAQEERFLERLALVVTDLHFDNSAADGLAVGRMVKERRPGLPVYLCSDAELGGAQLAGIDRRIAKEPVAFAELR